MADWTRVTWTEAGQITGLARAAFATVPAVSATPQQYFQTLLADGRRDKAITFLGIALPRFESVTWAARSVRKVAAPDDDPASQDTIKSVDRWLAEPTDACRRAVWDAASAIQNSTPVKLLASAIFLSGGSMAPEDLPPVLPEQHLCGTLASAAILVAAHHAKDPDAVVADALQTGVTIAEGKPV
jgi:hypothetical protein